ncbi:uncharacterized protein Z518_03277 [Rhinocladiella mackenziei CBS 650.93]|uniref:Phospholipid scramblase n=1 Tax=Rhinocladiella mackenziei CBS 650.93 TaxID=1442369 RepID=A0A0D2IYZ8_9EURO|nr:uncharacterized protein Z518_03277 [Rhinocladiella mackenziei CBS 650.93]KIX08621.1 hypothetical protein Z518_03277 [Rhinocladiella mackenziei CBS 650.93]
MDSKLDVPPQDEQYESEASDAGNMPPPPYRRASESSTERSLYDEKDVLLENRSGSYQQPTSSAMQEYNWYHPKIMSRGLIITDGASSTATKKTAIYYVEVSEFAVKKPDVILHSASPISGDSMDFDHVASASESGPVLGVAHFPHFSRHYKVCLGDPSSANPTTWVDITNPHKMYHGEFTMSYQGKSYVWKRTHDAALGVGGGDIRQEMTWNSFQLLDSATGEMIALFLENTFKSWKKKGKLRIFKDLEGSEEARQFKLLVFLSIAAILEKARRRANRQRNAHGGGGP